MHSSSWFWTLQCTLGTVWNAGLYELLESMKFKSVFVCRIVGIRKYTEFWCVSDNEMYKILRSMEYYNLSNTKRYGIPKSMNCWSVWNSKVLLFGMLTSPECWNEHSTEVYRTLHNYSRGFNKCRMIHQKKKTHTFHTEDICIDFSV